jgi:hypothetical protein
MLGLYPSFAAISVTRSIVYFGSNGLPASARETVEGDTPAAFAMSFRVRFFIRFFLELKIFPEAGKIYFLYVKSGG